MGINKIIFIDMYFILTMFGYSYLRITKKSYLLLDKIMIFLIIFYAILKSIQMTSFIMHL